MIGSVQMSFVDVTQQEKSNEFKKTTCLFSFSVILRIPRHLCFKGLRDPKADRELAVRHKPWGRLHTQAQLGWVTPLPSLYYSCEASGTHVAASNGHRWCGVTSQVLCEFLVTLLHSFKDTKSTLLCIHAVHTNG